ATEFLEHAERPLFGAPRDGQLVDARREQVPPPERVAAEQLVAAFPKLAHGHAGVAGEPGEVIQWHADDVAGRLVVVIDDVVDRRGEVVEAQAPLVMVGAEPRGRFPRLTELVAIALDASVVADRERS